MGSPLLCLLLALGAGNGNATTKSTRGVEPEPSAALLAQIHTLGSGLRLPVDLPADLHASLELFTPGFDSYLILRDLAGNVVAEGADEVLGLGPQLELPEAWLEHHPLESLGEQEFVLDVYSLSEGVDLAAYAEGLKAQWVRGFLGDLDARASFERRRIEEALNHARELGGREVGALLDSAARLEEVVGNWTQAENLRQEAWNWARDQFGEESVQAVQELRHLAELAMQRGDPEAALEWLHQAGEHLVGEDVLQKLLGPEFDPLLEGLREGNWRELAEDELLQLVDPHAREWIRELASIWGRGGKDEAARALLEQLQGTLMEQLGVESLPVGEVLRDLGSLAKGQDDFQAAGRLLQAAEEIFAQQLSPEHVETSRTLLTLGEVWSELGQADAQEALERGTQWLQQALGEAHPEFAQALGRSAERLADVDFTKGLDASSTALELIESSLGRHHPETARQLQRVARVLGSEGLASTGMPLAERAVRILEDTFGEDHPEVGRALQVLGWLQQLLELFEDASNTYARAVAIHQAFFGAGSPEVASSLEGLAASELGQAQQLAQAGADPSEVQALEDSAREHYERATSFTAALDASSSDSALGATVIASVGASLGLMESLFGLGDLLSATGDAVGASLAYSQGLTQFARIYGEAHQGRAALLARACDQLLRNGAGSVALALAHQFTASEDVVTVVLERTVQLPASVAADSPAWRDTVRALRATAPRALSLHAPSPLADEASLLDLTDNSSDLGLQWSRLDAASPLGLGFPQPLPVTLWEFSYRFQQERFDSVRDARNDISSAGLFARGYEFAPTSLTRDQHVFEVRHGDDSGWTLFGRVPWVENRLDFEVETGDGRERRRQTSEGLGDVELGGTTEFAREDRGLGEGSAHVLHLGLRLPTGSIDERDGGLLLPYVLQPGDGVWSFLPGWSYHSQYEDWSWGVRVLGNVHLNRNDRRWAPGDGLRAALWAARPLGSHFEGLLGIESVSWGDYHGRDRELVPSRSPLEDKFLQGGARLDLLTRLSTQLGSHFRGSIELAIPVDQWLDGPQLATESILNIGLRLSF